MQWLKYHDNRKYHTRIPHPGAEPFWRVIACPSGSNALQLAMLAINFLGATANRACSQARDVRSAKEIVQPRSKEGTK